MEEIIRNIVMIACTSFVVGFLLLAVVGIVGLLCETIREHNLAGLSAPQIGYDKRIICINFNIYSHSRN